MAAQFGMTGTRNATSDPLNAMVDNACFELALTAQLILLDAQLISEEALMELLMMLQPMMAITVLDGKEKVHLALKCIAPVVVDAHSTETTESFLQHLGTRKLTSDLTLKSLIHTFIINELK
jgi:hypothetical protein